MRMYMNFQYSNGFLCDSERTFDNFIDFISMQTFANILLTDCTVNMIGITFPDYLNKLSVLFRYNMPV